jgi:hypothetical protein
MRLIDPTREDRLLRRRSFHLRPNNCQRPTDFGERRYIAAFPVWSAAIRRRLSFDASSDGCQPDPSRDEGDEESPRSEAASRCAKELRVAIAFDAIHGSRLGIVGDPWKSGNPATMME